MQLGSDPSWIALTVACDPSGRLKRRNQPVESNCRSGQPPTCALWPRGFTAAVKGLRAVGDARVRFTTVSEATRLPDSRVTCVDGECLASEDESNGRTDVRMVGAKPVKYVEWVEAAAKATARIKRNSAYIYGVGDIAEQLGSVATPVSRGILDSCPS
jgi:hypothetical protein